MTDSFDTGLMGFSPEPLPFTSVLVANRGEIALRVFNSAKRRGLKTIAIHSDPDVDAAFVAQADVAVSLGGSTSAESYLDVTKVLDAAARTGAQAIHPGYGFLSENPDFAQAVIDAGMTWIGPTPESIRSMALKVEAKRLAEAAGVPLVPGAELALDADDQALLDVGQRVGYPLLVKASAGGGGKGMRVVDSPDELVESVAAARREAQSSFGDPTVFFERYLTNARHVEVQVFGDTQGNAVHLFERECSIQRRHQKIVEESPSPGATSATLDAMYTAAVSLTKQIGYVGAGTVEFMVSGEGDQQEFYFLEMNTRLQVEHPVTEAVTGLDLVDWQFDVAAGRALPLPQDSIRRSGHAIEVRLYAEDPAHDYLPQTGRLTAMPDSSNGIAVRVDSAYASAGGEVSSFYDPMLAKFIAHESTREQAAETLIEFLGTQPIAGIRTNRDQLRSILQSLGFSTGATTTNFLDEHPDLVGVVEHDNTALVDAAIRIVLQLSYERAASEPWFANVPIGFRSSPVVPERFDFVTDDAAAEPVTTFVSWTGVRQGHVTVACGEVAAQLPPGVLAAPEDSRTAEFVLSSAPSDEATLTVAIDGIRERSTVHRLSNDVWLVDGTTLREVPRFADPSDVAAGGGPSAPVPGTVVTVEVQSGDEVSEGQTLVVMEAMKMEHRITAPEDGVIDDVLVGAGDSVSAGQPLVTFVESDGDE